MNLVQVLFAYLFVGLCFSLYGFSKTNHKDSMEKAKERVGWQALDPWHRKLAILLGIFIVTIFFFGLVLCWPLALCIRIFLSFHPEDNP
jgi:hypothetical protein